MAIFPPQGGSGGGGGGGAADLSDVDEDVAVRSNHRLTWTDSTSAGGTADSAIERFGAGELVATAANSTPSGLFAATMDYGPNASTRRIRIKGSSSAGVITLDNGGILSWHSAGSWATKATNPTPDVGIKRSAAGVLRVTRGQTSDSGALEVGTTGLTLADGDLAAGLSSGGYRLQWDASAGDLLLKNSGGTTTATLATAGAAVGGTVLPSIQNGRLTVSSSDPLGEAASQGTLYYLAHKGNKVALYDGSSAWEYHDIPASTSYTLSGVATASRPYDVFLYDNSGTLTLDLVVWTNATTRATSLATQDSIYVKSGATSRRYVGTIYADASKQITFNSTERGIWNENNRIAWASSRKDTTDTWTYTTDTWRQANGSTSNSVPLMLGGKEAVDATYYAAAVWDSPGARVGLGIGIDSSTVNSAVVYGGFVDSTHGSALAAFYKGRPGEGYRDFRMLERTSAGSGTVTWFGDAGEGTTGNMNYGLVLTSWH